MCKTCALLCCLLQAAACMHTESGQATALQDPLKLLLLFCRWRTLLLVKLLSNCGSGWPCRLRKYLTLSRCW